LVESHPECLVLKTCNLLSVRSGYQSHLCLNDEKGQERILLSIPGHFMFELTA